MLRSEILKSLGFSLLIALQAQAAPVFDNPNAYYGQDFYNELAQGNLKNQNLKDKLNAILKKVHHLTTPFFQFCSQTQVSLPQTIFIKCSIFQKKIK